MTHRSNLRRAAAGVAAVAVFVAAACTPDPDVEGEGAAPTPTAAPTTVAAAGIRDDCPPAADPGLEVPANWSDEPLEVEVGARPLIIDVADGVDADCFALLDTFSGALDIPIPDLGVVDIIEGTTLGFAPPNPPSDPDRPERPWWGQDRLRLCVALADGRQACTNLDIDVVRADVVALAERFEINTRPKMLSPLVRAGIGDEVVSPGGIARLQDAYAATWALQLVAATVQLPQPPLVLEAACETSGGDAASLFARGEQLLVEHDRVVDVESVELTTSMGMEPPDDLSAAANAALLDVAAWLDCQL